MRIRMIIKRIYNWQNKVMQAYPNNKRFSHSYKTDNSTSYELMNLQQRCAKCIDFFAPLYYFLFVVSQIFEYLNIPLIEISDRLLHKNNIHCKVFSQIYILDSLRSWRNGMCQGFKGIIGICLHVIKDWPFGVLSNVYVCN